MISSVSTSSSLGSGSTKGAKFHANLSTWRSQMEHLLNLRADQLCDAKCREIEHAVEYSIASLPPAVREMKFSDFVRMAHPSLMVFPMDFVAPRNKAKQSFSCQTSPQATGRREHQTQTPVYTAHKRSRSDMENGEVASKIRTQLATESQHVILPATSEYVDMPPSKKQQIVSILNAIVSTYEDIVDIAGSREDEETMMQQGF